MTKQSQDIISSYMGCEPIVINSNLVSAQNRHRLYWTNIPVVGLPIDKGLLLKDIVNDDFIYGGTMRGRYNLDKTTSQCHELNGTFKSNAITSVDKDSLIFSINGYTELCKKQIRKNAKTLNEKSIALTGNNNVTGSGTTTIDLLDGVHYRKLSIQEKELLQTVPIGYTSYITKGHAGKMLGNGWTVDIIVHILKGIK